MQPTSTRAIYFRNFVFGGEDSLVSTVGLLAGVAVGGVPRADIVLTGLVLIFVEALSMAVGSFLSESSTEAYLAQSEVPARRAFLGSVIMFVSYFLLGFIPLAPYMVADLRTAFWLSIVASIVALVILGTVSGRQARLNPVRSAVRMAILGGSAIIIGVLVGRLVRP